MKVDLLLTDFTILGWISWVDVLNCFTECIMYVCKVIFIHKLHYMHF